MEDISLFSTSAVFEELELFNPLPAIEEGGFLDEYDVYSFLEDPGVKPPPNLLAEDLLQEFEIEGKNHFPKTLSGQSCEYIYVYQVRFLFCRGLITCSLPVPQPPPPPPRFADPRQLVNKNFRQLTVMVAS